MLHPHYDADLISGLEFLSPAYTSAKAMPEQMLGYL